MGTRKRRPHSEAECTSHESAPEKWGALCKLGIDFSGLLMYTMDMTKRIHPTEKKPKRIEIGIPFEVLAASVLPQVNTGNLSTDWTLTDAVRFLMAEGYKARGHELPREAQDMLKSYWSDLDV